MARESACSSGSALRRPEVLAEVLARGFERKAVASDRWLVWQARRKGNEASMMAALPEKARGAKERGDSEQPAV